MCWNNIEEIKVSGFWVKKLKYKLKTGEIINFKKVDVYISEDQIRAISMQNFN